MPDQDHTGPVGEGSRTGGGQGTCPPPEAEGAAEVRGVGRGGRPRGGGRGRCFGGGRGSGAGGGRCRHRLRGAVASDRTVDTVSRKAEEAS
jgi:hypothetical protein